MVVTPFGIVILVSPAQFSKEPQPIDVTPFGIVMLVSPVQPLNA